MNTVFVPVIVGGLVGEGTLRPIISPVFVLVRFNWRGVGCSSPGIVIVVWLAPMRAPPLSRAIGRRVGGVRRESWRVSVESESVVMWI